MTSTRTPPSRSLLLRPWTIILVTWTLLVLLLLHFIQLLPSDTIRVVKSSESGIFGNGDWWYLFHANFHALYPILLLAPYIAFVSVSWTLGATRWWLSIPLHFLCLIAVLPASRWLDDRITEALPSLVYVNGGAAKVGRVTADGNAVSIPIEMPEKSAAGTAGKIGIVIETSGLKVTTEGPASNPSKHAETSRPGDWLKGDQEGLVIPAVGFLVISGIAHASAYHRRFRVRELQSSQLESQLTRSRLAALQSQLHPHFLFNTLNGIITLIRHRPVVAEEMLTSLSDLLRSALDSSKRHIIPLSHELAFLNRYVSLQRMRFEDRLQVTWDVEPDTLEIPVPALLLQPLVENAILHGIEPSPRRGRLSIITSLVNSNLIIEIEDNGVGFEQGTPFLGTGHGTVNVRELLTTFYPEKHRFEISSRVQEGTCVTIQIPLQPLSRGVLA